MQHPVGYKIGSDGRPELSNIWAVMTNPVFLWGYAHVLLASLVTAAVVMLAVSVWHLRRRSYPETFGRSARLSLIVLFPATLFAMLIGSELGVVEARYQPMKIAAAEAQWDSCQPCSFSIFQIGGGNNDQTPTQIIQIPHLLSLLATNHWNGAVTGLNQVQAQYEQQFGPGDYVPNVFIQYWSMRVMAYAAVLVILLALLGLYLTWRHRLDTATWYHRLAIWAIPLPFLMNTAGWLLTESGRQPWVVQGIQRTSDGVSTSVGSGTIIASIVVFLLLYGALAVIDVVLMTRYSRRSLDAPQEAAYGEPASEPAFSR
jgi:cytochrome d ubiquinol oxidase subunit I